MANNITATMQIPTSHITSTLIPSKASVYERQVAKLNCERQRAEELRLENESRKFREEMLEVTGKPRINRNINVEVPFDQRTEEFETEKTQKFKLLREEQKTKQIEPTFEPQINPASAYLAESRKALSQASNNLTSDYYLKTTQLKPVEQHFFMPEITELAAKLPPDPHIYDRLSQPKIEPAEELTLVDQPYSATTPPSARVQQLESQRLHSEYSKFMMKREELEDKASEDLKRQTSSEDRIERDILAYKAELRKLEKKSIAQESQRDGDNCTFAPRIDDLSRMLTQSEPGFMQRYDNELERIRQTEQLNEEKRREREELNNVTPVYQHTRPVSDLSLAEFYQRQEEHLERQQQARYQKELVRRQQEEAEMRYIIEHREYRSSSSKVPSNLHDQLLLTDESQCNELVENLANDNVDDRIEKILELGNNVPMTAVCLQDSVARHVTSVRKATEERRRRFEQLKLRD